MFSYWAFILVGNDKTGKTTFQRKVVKYLCDKDIKHLNKNFPHKIKRTNFPSTLYYLFTMNRSFQEVKSYESVPNYFKSYFKEADICILSSHPKIDDIEEMISQLHKRYYNICGIFWSNSKNNQTAQISSSLNWDERIWFANPITRIKNKQNKQIENLALNFTDFLLKRSLINN